MRNEVVKNNVTYIVENQIIVAVKAPLNINGAAHILYNIGKNINEI